MSQTSSTPGREAQSQSSNPTIYRAMGEEIDRLTNELEKAHAREARLREDFEAHRESAQQWQTRAEEAERELSRVQGRFPEFNNAWRTMGQAFANVTGQVIDDGDDAILLPEDTQDIHMADDESTPVFDPSSMRRSNRGIENSEPLLSYAPNTFSRLGSDLQRGSLLRRSSLSGISSPRTGFEPGLQGLKGPSSQPPSPPPPPCMDSQPPPPPNPTYPRQSTPQPPSSGETISPGDRHTTAHNDTEGRSVVTNPVETPHGTQEASPVAGESPSSTDSDSDGLPEGWKLVRGRF